MCGIAGIIHFDGAPVQKEPLRRMAAAIAHRGPDGEGLYVSGQVGFAHRRLAIIDLSPEAAQPMHYQQYVLCYNGEIYNYRELKKELQQLGWHFTTNSDSEVLVASYAAWGEGCVQRFNGMWSFAIFDSEKQEVFCSRDRYGKKPFYFFRTHDRFIFCSEIKGLLTVLRNVKANATAVVRYLVNSEADEDNSTFFEGIEKLPAGNNAIISMHKATVQLHRYYRLEKKQGPWHDANEAQVVDKFRTLFEHSIDLRLRSDVPVGTCLSGGLDSSYVALTAARKYEWDRPFTAVTASTPGLRTDEKAAAASVAAAGRLRHVVVAPASNDFKAAFSDVIRAQEEPFENISVFMQYFVMQQAATEGLRVMLDGQGADEILLGYIHHLAFYLHRLSPAQLVSQIPKAAKHYNVSVRMLAKLYFYFANFSFRYQRQAGQWAFLKPEFLQIARGRTAGIHKSKLYHGDFFHLQRYEIETERLPRLLRYEDKNSMHFSIETRLPFLDVDLANFAVNLPVGFKLKGGWSKYLLRKAMEPVAPASITWQQGKVGFAAPEAIWLADNTFLDKIINESALVRQFCSHKPSKLDTQQRWRLACLAAWEKEFGVEG